MATWCTYWWVTSFTRGLSVTTRHYNCWNSYYYIHWTSASLSPVSCSFRPTYPSPYWRSKDHTLYIKRKMVGGNYVKFLFPKSNHIVLLLGESKRSPESIFTFKSASMSSSVMLFSSTNTRLQTRAKCNISGLNHLFTSILLPRLSCSASDPWKQESWARVIKHKLARPIFNALTTATVPHHWARERTHLLHSFFNCALTGSS